MTEMTQLDLGIKVTECGEKAGHFKSEYKEMTFILNTFTFLQ